MGVESFSRFFADSLREAGQEVDINFVLDLLGHAEMVHKAYSGAAISTGVGGVSDAVFTVPPKTTVVIISAGGGGYDLTAGGIYTWDLNRYAAGTGTVTVAGLPVPAVMPATATGGSLKTQADATLAMRGAVLYNPTNAATAGLLGRLTLCGPAASNGGTSGMAVRYFVVPGNPFNAEPTMWVA